MAEIILRDYQRDQTDFINAKIKGGGLPIAIQSPTGSGKTITIIKWVIDYFKAHEGEDFTIVLSTGFNKLVFQFAEEARKFGLDPIVFMGKGSSTCKTKYQKKYGKEYVYSRKNAFTTELDEACNKGCSCFLSKSGSCNIVKAECQTAGPKFIITNHSSYLIGIFNETFTPNYAFIDESHTFGQFYEGYLSTEVMASEIYELQNVLKKSNDPSLLAFNNAMKTGKQIVPALFSRIENICLDKIETKSKEFQDKWTGLIARLSEIQLTEPSESNYIEINTRGMKLTRFYTKFNVMQENIQYILFSATQDSFTLDMFGLSAKLRMNPRLYVERKVNTVDYRKSEFCVLEESTFMDGARKFVSRMESKGYSKGLILSTTNKNVDDLKALGSMGKYQFTNNMEAFERKDNMILIGSRALFQGIDIKGLDFVLLNAIPFPAYDEKFQKQAAYLKKYAKIDPWSGFTTPKVGNDIIQTTGRLWRNPGDKGSVGIVDPRLNKRFKWMQSYVTAVRKGIKVINI